jgi:hypothetical protein
MVISVAPAHSFRLFRLLTGSHLIKHLNNQSKNVNLIVMLSRREAQQFASTFCRYLSLEFCNHPKAFGLQFKLNRKPSRVSSASL